MPEPRIAPGGLKELGVVNHALTLIAARAIGGRRPNIFTTLGRQRGLFRAWLNYSARMMPFGKLPRRETELIILRIATQRGCDYEYGHHVRLGRRAGITAEQIEHLGDSDWSGWSTREKAFFAAADQYVDQRDIDDVAWGNLRMHLNEAEAIEFLLLCGQYDSLATTLMTLRIQPD